MSRPRTPVPAELRHAARRFESWRMRRTKRVLPPELWGLAADLAARMGVSPVARELRLDYYEVKRRLCSSRPPRPEAPAFVEIVSAPPDPARKFGVEFENAHGTRMRMTCSACGAPDLAALGRLFLGRPSGPCDR